ncbi:class I SAM-dependent methyltransferase [Actinokineospora sp. NPDC004072]
MRHKWDAYAARYDRDIAFWERLQVGDGREWVCGQASGDVLEVAVGTGRNLPHYPPGVRLTGVDFSPAMLAIAAERARASSLQVDLREADAQALPFPDGSFDTVVCTLGLCGFPDERAAIAEMRRVLRPGGLLLLLDHVGSHHRPIRFAQWLLEQVTKRMIGDYQTRRPLPLVEAAGLRVERSQRLKAGTVERLAARKPLTP